MFVFQDFKISRFQDFSIIIHISTYISRFQVFQDFKIFQILNLNYNPNLHTLENSLIFIENQLKIMEFKDFPMFLGKSGKYEIHPPKLCAGMHLSTVTGWPG